MIVKVKRIYNTEYPEDPQWPETYTRDDLKSIGAEYMLDGTDKDTITLQEGNCIYEVSIAESLGDYAVENGVNIPATFIGGIGVDYLYEETGGYFLKRSNFYQTKYVTPTEAEREAAASAINALFEYDMVLTECINYFDTDQDDFMIRVRKDGVMQWLPLHTITDKEKKS